MQSQRTTHGHAQALLALVFALLLQTALALPAQVLASDYDPYAPYTEEDLAAQAYADQLPDPFAPEDGTQLQAQQDMPAHYDMRHVMVDGVEKCFVTPVRVQNPYGSCWGFGAIAAAESSILSSGLASDPATLDLSEKQVVWFTATTLDDPSNRQNGEGTLFVDDATPQERYNAGGITFFATNLFASGTGPVAESTQTNYGQIFKYQGIAGEAVCDYGTWIDADGQQQSGFRRSYYSEDDDWVIPEAYRFWQDYLLKESYLLPSPASCQSDDELATAIGAIKSQLLQNRAVCIDFCAETSQPGQETKWTDAFSENWAQYQDYGMPSNHVVTIVGYDDDYPQDKFATKPPAAGAWLVKNSWGSDLQEYPNNGYRHWGLQEGMDVPGSTYEATSDLHTGYFWLSYYDKSIRDPEAYSFDAATPGMVIDQHDFMPVSEYGQFSSDAQALTANVFTAAQDQQLQSIAFVTTTPETTASYQIYLLGDDAANPQDGTCVVTSQPKTYPYGGYHREQLEGDAAISLTKGQRYAVVVQQQTPSGKYNVSVGASRAEDFHNFRWFRSVVNQGESFFLLDGVWHDMTDGSIDSLIEAKQDDIRVLEKNCYDNFCIKAYAMPTEPTQDKPQPDPVDIQPRAPYLDLRDNKGKPASDRTQDPHDTVTYRATIRSAEELEVQPTFTWTSSDEGVFTVTPDPEKGGAWGKMTPVHYGEAILTVDAGVYGSKSIKITVDKYHIYDAGIADEDRVTVYTGDPYEPEPVKVEASTPDYEGTYDVTRGVDYEVVYENNVQCGRGEVIVNGIGDYGGSVRSTSYNDLSFLILPAKAQITGVEPRDGTIVVNFASQQESGISGYVLSYTKAGTKDTQTMKLDAAATSAVIEGLEPGATYEISLAAYVTTQDYVEDVVDKVAVDHLGEASDVVSVTASRAVEPADPEEQVTPTEKVEPAPASNGTASKSTAKKSRTLPRTGDTGTATAGVFAAGMALLAAGILQRSRRRS